MLKKEYRNRSIATKVLKYFKQNKVLPMLISNLKEAEVLFNK